MLAGQAQTQNRNNALALGQFSESLQGLSSRVSPSVVQISGTGFGLEHDGVQEGDVIHAVNGQPITSVETLRSALNNLKLADSIVLQVERDGSLMFVVLESN